MLRSEKRLLSFGPVLQDPVLDDLTPDVEGRDEEDQGDQSDRFFKVGFHGQGLALMTRPRYLSGLKKPFTKVADGAEG